MRQVAWAHRRMLMRAHLHRLSAASAACPPRIGRHVKRVQAMVRSEVPISLYYREGAHEAASAISK